MNSNNNIKIDFYNLFGIDKNFSESELKRAYYRLSLQYHPEKNAKMSDMFQFINNAYEILNSPQKKKIYDEHGISAFNGVEIKEEYKKAPHKKLNDFEVSVFDDLNENSLIKFDESSEDLSSDILNYSYLSSGVKLNEEEEEIIVKKPTPSNKNINIDVTLEELYCGAEKEIKIERSVICPECYGNHQTFGVCDTCLGNGFTYNVTLEQEVPCISCDGTGKKKIDKNGKCVYCEGKSTIQETKILIAHILPGMKHNEKIIFKGEGDQTPQSPPNDIIACINLLPHKKYNCSGNDLIINVKITLKEALCGLRRRIKFLDGSYLSIMTNPGEVITPNSIKSYKNKGLVKNVGSKEKGNLKIKFYVQFPENNWTTTEDIKILEKILSKGTASKTTTEDRILPANINSMTINNKEILKDHLLNKPKELSSQPSFKSHRTATPPPFSPLRPTSQKTAIDQFYQCDINSSREINPRTICVADPSVLERENNPPRTISVIDSVIMPVKGESFSNNSSDDSQETIKSVRRGDDFFERNSQETIKGVRRGDDFFERSSQDTVRSVRRDDIFFNEKSSQETLRSIRRIEDGYRSESEKISPAIRALRRGDDGYRSESEKISPAIRALRREDSKRAVYSDEESYKLINVLPSKSVKSPKELELAEKNKQVISNSKNEIIPPPLPPFPKMQKQLMHSQSFTDKKLLNNSHTFNIEPINDKNLLINPNHGPMQKPIIPKPIQGSMSGSISGSIQTTMPPPKQPPMQPLPQPKQPLPPPMQPLPQPIQSSKQPLQSSIQPSIQQSIQGTKQPLIQGTIQTVQPVIQKPIQGPIQAKVFDNTFNREQPSPKLFDIKPQKFQKMNYNI